LEAENTVNTDRDVTRHAELNLVSRATRCLDPDTLSKCVLYTSTEPCMMCTGAIFWAGIGTIVYGCSARRLAEITGGDFDVPCAELLASAHSPAQIIGPTLEQAGAEIHQAFWNKEPSSSHLTVYEKQGTSRIRRG